MPFKPTQAVVPALTLALAGCFNGVSPTSVAPPPSSGMAIGMPVPAADLTSGPSLNDAHHQVQRYMVQHYPDARLLQVQADSVGAMGRIGRDGSWAFTYVVKHAVIATPSPATQPATDSLAAQAVEVPSQFETQYLRLVLTGSYQLLAPEAVPAGEAQPIDFERTIALSSALEACDQDGVFVGPFGVKVTLRTASSGTLVYEFDNTSRYPGGAQQQGYPPKRGVPTSGYGPYDEPVYGGGYAPVRQGIFVVDAYTGVLLARP